jgi:poly-gamma-glutamate synthesis protein (capsule biosynthesis protein)
MSKPTKILLWTAVGLAGLALIIGLIYFLVVYKKPVVESGQSRPVVTYSVAPGLEGRQQIVHTVTAKLIELGYKPQLSSDQADITIGSEPKESSEAIGQQQIGEPQPLQGATIVSPVSRPPMYVALDGSLTPAQKDDITLALEAIKKPSVSWTLNIAGDIIVGRTVYEQQMRKNDFTSSFHKVKGLLENADYTVANAEWTAADGIPYPLARLSFASPSRSLDGLTYAGIDAVSLANNHSMNGGVGAFEQMLSSLTARNIGYFGAGKNFADAHKPFVTEIKGTKVAFLGYTAIPGNLPAGPNSTGNAFIKIAPWFPYSEADIVQMETDIKTAKSQAEVVIPYFHWSQEYTHQANEQMRQDAGATMVVGSHPHWVQGIEWYNGHLIAYSLGNFVFDQEQMLKTKQGMVLHTTFNGSELVEAKLTPIQIEQYFQPHVLEGAPAQQVLNDIYTHSWWPQQ